MSLVQRLSPLTARLAQILATKKARRLLGTLADTETPDLAIYFGGSPSDLYQIKQWMPVFEEFQDDLPTVVLVKNSLAALELAKTSKLPIQLAGSADVIEPLAAQWGLKGIFYVNNNLSNFSVLRLPTVRHIHLSHGESEKASMTSNQLKAYDFCFVAGQASADRIMSALPLFERSHLKLIGRPQLDQLMNATPYPDSSGRKTVLYAPTWEGDRPTMAYSSIATAGEAWVENILQDRSLRVIYRPHPKTGTRNSAVRKADRRIRECIEDASKNQPSAGHFVDTSDAENRAMISADIAIFDVSAMAMDFSILNRPYFISMPPSKAFNPASSHLWTVADPLTSAEPWGVSEQVHDVLRRGVKPGVLQFVTQHFGENISGSGILRFRRAIDDVLR